MLRRTQTSFTYNIFRSWRRKNLSSMQDLYQKTVFPAIYFEKASNRTVRASWDETMMEVKHLETRK